MNQNSFTIIQDTFEASHQGRMHFGAVIEQLGRARVESYHVDYRCGRATYYLADDTTLDLRFDTAREPIAQAFDADALRAAIAGAQQGRVMYPEFMRLSQRAGCIGYTVWLAGSHVAYAGRRGQTHVEAFAD